MKFVPLLFSNLKRKRVRTALTLTSVVLAFLLFGVLEAVRGALSGGVQIAGQSRLITINRVSLVNGLPRSRLDRIRAVEGVTAASGEIWVAGVFRDERDPITTTAVTHDTFLQVNPDIALSDQARRDWLTERTGALVGRPLAEKHGWKVGDIIPLRSTIMTKTDGSSIWDLKIVGIFDYTTQGRDAKRIFFHYDYLNESVNALKKDRIGWVVFKIDDPNRAVDIARQIDEQFVNSSAETKTTTEQAFAQDYAKQIGNVGAVLVSVASVVFFTILLVTANTMGQSVRERTNELAIMRAIGFASGTVVSLVLLEAVLIVALGGVTGLGLAALLSASIGPALQQVMPFAGVPGEAYVIGGAMIVLIGVLSGMVPCIQAAQLQITDALRRR